jgi:hypothetical protein
MRSAKRYAGTLFSGSATGWTGNFPQPGTFRTFFSTHFFSAIAYWAPYRFLAVTGFTTHLSPFILNSDVLEKTFACQHRSNWVSVLQDKIFM